MCVFYVIGRRFSRAKHTAMSASPGPSRAQVLALYKQFIKNANGFNNYNYREYFLRKARTTFRKNRALEDPATISAAWDTALKDLGVLKRQSVISQMYTFDKQVVEPLDPKHHSRG